MNLNKELQNLNNQLDKKRRQYDAARARRDMVTMDRFKRDMNVLSKKISALKDQMSRQNMSKAASIANMKFRRDITKAEQADMGKLKKSVRGLVVVHPLTGLGKELGLTTMTGFAPKEF